MQLRELKDVRVEHSVEQ